MSEERLDQALEAMVNEPIPTGEMAAAQERVFRKLMAQVPSLCMEFQAELAAYLKGELAENRRALMDDHLGRCAECRRIYAEAKGERKVVVLPAVSQRKPRPAWQRWALAASIGLVALYTGRDKIDSVMAPSGPRATLERVSGQVYGLTDTAMGSGATLSEGQIVRTGAGSRAVLRLADGSAVEMNERSQLFVHAAWSGATVQLDRGDVIVQAAKQRRGHLRVRTRDSEASVKGTVFAVSTGMSGSVVAVVEGAVEVNQPQFNKVLKPGEIAGSTSALSGMTAQEAVAWSAEKEKYFALLAEFAKLEKQIAALPTPALRTQATLVKYLPSNAVAFGAAPNISGTLEEAERLAQQRAEQNATFGEWWKSAKGEQVREMLAKVQAVMPLLGDEIGFVLAHGPGGDHDSVPMMIAEVNAGQQAAVRKALAPMVEGVNFGVNDKVVVITDNQTHLLWAMGQLGQGATSDFAADITQHYERGVGWMLGLNAQAFHMSSTERVSVLTGGTALKTVFFEQRTNEGSEENEATLSFAGTRAGIASWLAPAGASGAAEYITSDALMAFSGSTKEPSQMFSEITNLMGSMSPQFKQHLDEAQAKLGISFADDLAAALGTDFAVAVENANIPIPGWTAAMEVYKPGTLDGTIAKIVDAYNSELPAEYQSRKLSITQQTVDGRLWMTLKAAAAPMTLYWTHDRGYVVMSSDLAVAQRALKTRDGGFTLTRSAAFVRQMPSTAGVHPSGFLWMNLKGALEGLSSVVTSSALQTIAKDRDPILVVVNGETERIRVASRTRLTSLILDGMLAGTAADASSIKLNRKMKQNAASN
ncbi:FecR domain-containing protein [uncultured Paludibaculum sp.]|uniref:FecR domain-containing protein n=1 Tax=uncultured Paludibaculum sp. TaxID=1765020 RepID=UPI002AAC275D|nr:FecR domain-containing protein [uncultured Paludibaculum sp.]